MRARTIMSGQIDALDAGYRQFGGDIAWFSSDSAWFAFDTIDFVVDEAFVPTTRVLSGFRTASLQTGDAFQTLVSVENAGNPVSSGAPSFAAPAAENAIEVRALQAGRFEAPLRQLSEATSDTAPDISFAQSSQASTLLGLFDSPAIDFPQGTTIEGGFAVLDLFNLAPSAALNQGDTLYMFDQSDSFSYARYEMFGDVALNIGQDPFDLPAYLVGDTDNDGVNDFIIRLDAGGPTLLGTDLII